MPDPVMGSLLRINRQRLRALRQALAPIRYVGVMHLIMTYTNRHPGASQDEIACFYAVDKTSVARDAKRLEDMGHLRREIDPENRRQYKLYITGEGQSVLPVICQAYDSFAAKLSAGISQEDWQQLRRLLKLLEDNALS